MHVACCPCRYTNGGKDLPKYKDTKAVAKSVWVELNNSWHGEAPAQHSMWPQHFQLVLKTRLLFSSSCIWICGDSRVEQPTATGRWGMPLCYFGIAAYLLRR
jgi:hypothetical protein